MSATLSLFPAAKKSPLVPSKCEVVPMTAALARRFRDMPPLPGERPLRSGRVAFLMKAMEEVVLPFNWVQIIVDGEVRRANGQTTSYILSEMLATVPSLIHPGMVACITTYECASMEEASTVYGAIDSSRSARTISDIVAAFQGSDPKLQKHSKTMIELFQTGLLYAAYGFEHKSRSEVTPLQRGKLLYDNLEFIERMAEIIPARSDDTRHLRRAPVICAIKHTYDVSWKAARQFWTYVRHGDGAPRTAITLRDYLQTTHLSSRTTKRVDHAIAMYERCIRAWNAWRRGDELKKLPATGNIPDPV